MSVEKQLYDKIIEANLEVHEKEAVNYNVIHTFGENWYAQRKLWNDIRRMISLAPGKIACDLGCGTGNVTKKLLKVGCEVTAVDISKHMMSEFEKTVHAKDELKVVCMNIDEFLTNSDSNYDIITINAVLHHMPDYIDTISNALDHLSIGGLIYLVDGVHRDNINRFAEVIRNYFLLIDRKIHIAIKGGGNVIFNHKIDYSFSDYHCNAAGTNGLDINNIRELIRDKELEIVDFSAFNLGMYIGTLAYLDNMFSISKNCFGLIAQKTK